MSDYTMNTPGHHHWKAEVIADSSGKWGSNSLRFNTEEAAKAYAIDWASRWRLIREWRVEKYDGPPTDSWIDGIGIVNLKTGQGHMPARSVSL